MAGPSGASHLPVTLFEALDSPVPVLSSRGGGPIHLSCLAACESYIFVGLLCV